MEPARAPAPGPEAVSARPLAPIPEAAPLLPAQRHVQFETAPPAPIAPSSSGSSSDEDEEAAARPPDGGWGWVVVFASFMVNLIADGITFSFGVFYPHFLQYFGEGKGKTAWIAGIFMAMPLLSGPIASFLTDRYGCRRVTVCGSLLAALGFVISAFVDNMETLFLTFGIMAGFGLSLCYVAAVVIVAYYFDRKRSLATGISVCGSGIGTFLFAPLTYVLLDEYGWRGTTLLLAGLFLNMAVCGLLFRDLPWAAELHAGKARARRLRRQRRAAAACAAPTPAPPAPPVPGRHSSLVDLPTYMTAGEGVPPEVFELMSTRGRAYALLAHGSPGGMLPSRSFSDSGRLHEAACGPAARAGPGLRRGASARRAPASFLKDLRVHRHSLTYRGAMLNINRYRLRASSCPNIFRNSMTTIAKEKVVWYAGLWDFWDLAVEILDFSHFLNPAFLLFALSNFLLYMWYDVPYIYISDSGMSMGFDESQGSMLISIIGILNMFGEILLGWVGDWEGVSPSLVYALCMVLCGAVTALMPLLRSYLGLAAASGAFGAFIAANYSLTSIILVEQITLEKFTNAYGLLLLIQGMANLIGPPLAGWVFDMTGTYDLSFYLAGVFIGLSGLVLLVPPIARCLRSPRAPPATAPAAPGKELPDKHNGHLTLNGKILA